MRALGDGRLLVIGEFKDTMKSGWRIHVLAVNESRAIQRRSQFQFAGRLKNWDSTRSSWDDDTWLAFALVSEKRSILQTERATETQTIREQEEHAVALYKTIGNGIKLLSRCPLRWPQSPIFNRKSLFVLAQTDAGEWAVHELSTGGGRLQQTRVIPEFLRPQHVSTNDRRTIWNNTVWCIANRYLVTWNFEANSLNKYELIDD